MLEFKDQFKHKEGMKCKVYLTTADSAYAFRKDYYTYGIIEKVLKLNQTYTYNEYLSKTKYRCKKVKLFIKPVFEVFDDNEIDKFLYINEGRDEVQIEIIAECKKYLKKISKV